MAVIGTWGSIVFSVSRKKINTFDGLKWDGGAKFVTHERHLKEPLLEFVGTDVDAMSFSMSFSVFLGVDPMKEITKLQAAKNKGEVNRLVIGTKAYGTGKWVIDKLSNALERYDNKGNLLVAKVSVSMKAYAAR